MIDMQDKLIKVREFIQANPGKSNRWYADNNGVIKKTTFYKYLNDIVMDNQTDNQTDKTDNQTDKTDNQTDNQTDKTDKTDNQTDNQTDKTDKTDNQTDNESASTSTSSDELIQNLFGEHEKNEDRKSKNRRYNYNTRSRKALVEELQKENEELKSKYEELKSKYEELQTDFIFEKQLKDKYANQIHDFPFKQSEFDELKKKYERLQIDYIALKNGDKPDKQDKPETKTQWWEEI